MENWAQQESAAAAWGGAAGGSAEGHGGAEEEEGGWLAQFCKDQDMCAATEEVRIRRASEC